MIPATHTVIYTESWVAGSHWHTIVRMRRVTLQPEDDIKTMCEREEIDPLSVVYIFEGHPNMIGDETKG